MIATKGLTFRKGNTEANVHDVHDGVVYWARYLDGAELPTGLYRNTVSEFEAMAEVAIAEGAEVFMLVRPGGCNPSKLRREAEMTP